MADDRERDTRMGPGEWALTIFGLILGVTPLALWVAWTPTILLFVLLAAVAGLLVCGGITMFAPPDEGPSARGPGPVVTPYVPPDGRGMTELFRPYSREARTAYLKLVWRHRRLASELLACLLALGGLLLYLAWWIVENGLLALMP